MTTPAKESPQERPDIIGPDKARDYILPALESDSDNPEGLVKLLLILRDGAQESRVIDTLDFLIDEAFARSTSFIEPRQAYLNAIREGRDPVAACKPAAAAEAARDEDEPLTRTEAGRAFKTLIDALLGGFQNNAPWVRLMLKVYEGGDEAAERLLHVLEGDKGDGGRGDG